MGKRYYCEYCDKTMVSAPSIVKIHNNGIMHQKLVMEHYQQYKDPEVILREEQSKNPCSRFAKGICQFGAICRYSHYTREQIKTMRAIVENRKVSKENRPQPSFQDLYHRLQEAKTNKSEDDGTTIMYDSNGVTYVLPWTYNSEFEKYPHLPQSLKKFSMDDFVKVQIAEWG